MNISTDVDRANKSDDRVMYSGDPNLKPSSSTEESCSCITAD